MSQHSSQVVKKALFHLDLCQRFPYDAPDSWRESDNDQAPPQADDWAHLAARAVIHDLGDRRDIKQPFQKIDEDVRVEMVQQLAEIIRQSRAVFESNAVKS